MRISGYWGTCDLSSAENGVVVNSCGHNFLANGDSINRPKGREDYLLLYVHKEYEYFTFTNTCKAVPGSVVLFQPFEVQNHYYDGNQTAENYYVHFSVPDSDLMTKVSIPGSAILTLEPSRQIVELFETIIRELQIKRPHYKVVSVACLTELICLLDRKIDHYNNSNQRTAIQTVSQVINFIHENYYLDTSLEQYAQACGLSKFHFSHLFKQATGTSPIVYRNQIRIQHAQALLEESNQTISDISHAVGYNNSTYFCNLFRSMTGISPRQYRQNHS